MQWIRVFLDWFWYYRRGKIKYRVFNIGDSYCASAHSRKISVWNCYGSTSEQALEVANYRMRVALEEINTKNNQRKRENHFSNL
jgi:hypothetical protein